MQRTDLHVTRVSREITYTEYSHDTSIFHVLVRLQRARARDQKLKFSFYCIVSFIYRNFLSDFARDGDASDLFRVFSIRIHDRPERVSRIRKEDVKIRETERARAPFRGANWLFRRSSE